MRKFKCIKSYESGEWLTKGKIYTEDNGRFEYDDGWVDETFDYDVSHFEDGSTMSDYLEEVFDEEIKEDKKMSKFKVGDMVKILDGSNIGEYTYGWVSEMNGNVDKIAKILSIEEENGLPCYCLNDFDYVKDTGVYIYDERGLELVEDVNITPKTLTITTSDTTTTLTEGTHITSINRYYTDKHDDMVALEEVVKKYKSEMDEINKDKEIKEAIDKFIKDNNYDVEVEVKRKVIK